MSLQAKRIRRRGFATTNFSYRSVRHSLSKNAERLTALLRAVDSPKIHLVGHSLGGLIILRSLCLHPDERVGRVILLGTPYVDSWSAHALCRASIGRTISGKSIEEWLHQEKFLLADNFDIGVIAGSQSFGAGRLIFGPLPGINDGVVLVEETYVPGMRDHIVLNVSHSGMLVATKVADQICEFLRSGKFKHENIS